MDELVCSFLDQKCYHSPSWSDEPCGLSKDCANNLTCENGKCKRTTFSDLGEHCEGDGNGCIVGLSCSNVLHKCFHFPREEDEPCAAENSCGHGLVCSAYSSKCFKAKELHDHCVIGEC